VHIEWICKSVRSPAFLICATKLDKLENTISHTEESFKKVIEIANQQTMEICEKSKLAERKITLGGKVIMTSVKDVGQKSQLTSMSDLAKYINSMTKVASEQGKIFIPESWESFGKHFIICNLIKILI
jgi:hypothetical protein